jgi:hypothetical protein
VGAGQSAWILAIQTRVAATAKTLGDAKGLKLTGLTDRAFATLQELRKQEISASQAFRKILISIMVFGKHSEPSLRSGLANNNEIQQWQRLLPHPSYHLSSLPLLPAPERTIL